jgi:hypothetical protein
MLSTYSVETELILKFNKERGEFIPQLNEYVRRCIGTFGLENYSCIIVRYYIKYHCI